MNLFEYRGRFYPEHLREGNHLQYVLPVARKFCVGMGIDVGGNTLEWAFPGATICDITQAPPWNDMFKLPVGAESHDYVISSHCLEHSVAPIAALEEWTRVIKPGGTLFLYLPSIKCEYWRCVNNRKHLHEFKAGQIERDLLDLGYDGIFTSGIDLAWSFAVAARKKEK